MVKVFFGKQEIGEVHELTFALGDGGPTLLTLGGRSWVTKHVDWSRKKAYVEPTDIKGRSQWLSTGQPLHFEMCQAIEAVLLSDQTVEGLSARGRTLLEELREEFAWLEQGRSTLLVDEARNVTWWTFAGATFNAAIAHLAASSSNKVSFDNLAISFTKVNEPGELKARIEESLGSGDPDIFVAPIDAHFVQELKFSDCLPANLMGLVASSRYATKQESIVLCLERRSLYCLIIDLFDI